MVRDGLGGKGTTMPSLPLAQSCSSRCSSAALVTVIAAALALPFDAVAGEHRRMRLPDGAPAKGRVLRAHRALPCPPRRRRGRLHGSDRAFVFICSALRTGLKARVTAGGRGSGRKPIGREGDGDIRVVWIRGSPGSHLRMLTGYRHAPPLLDCRTCGGSVE